MTIGRYALPTVRLGGLTPTQNGAACAAPFARSVVVDYQDTLSAMPSMTFHIHRKSPQE